MMNFSLHLLTFYLVLIYINNANGACSDQTTTRTNCLSKALGDTNGWHTCDYCLCEEMGGACKDDTFKDVLECQVKADVSDHQLLCRLSLQETYLISFSVAAFILGSIISFLIYLYYKTADWSKLWQSDRYKYFRSGQVCIDLVKCAPFTYCITGQACADCWESIKCICECKFCTQKYWGEVCQCIYECCAIPEGCKNLFRTQPVFKSSKGGGGGSGGYGGGGYSMNSMSPQQNIAMTSRGRNSSSPNRV